MIRGIDHAGITVPDLDSAVAFFVSALGCEQLYANESAGSAHEALGAAPGSVVRDIRFLRCGDGAAIELFAFDAPGRRTDPPLPSDLAIQHLAFYADDVEAVAARVRECGGEVLGEPRPLPGREAGPDNRFVYCRTPWGMTFELIAYPSAVPAGRVRPDSLAS